MQLTSPSRRVFGILAAGTIGLSTALLGVTGVAQAGTSTVAATVPVGPSAPTQIDIYGADHQLNVYFADDEMAVDSAWADSWEYELTSSGGTGNVSTWTPFTPQNQSGMKYAEFTGLTNGTEYSLTIRGVGIDHNNGDAPVDGTASAPQTGTPYAAATAPGTPTVVVGPSSVNVTWTGSTAGTYPIAHYDVLANLDLDPNAQMGGPTSICTVSATARSCTAPVKAGRTYEIAVVASDTHNNSSDESAHVTSAVVPAPSVPAAVPAKNGDLALPAGATSTVAPGKTMTVSGSGYAPNSTISVAIYSTPQVLTTVVTDASGNFTATVTVPANLAAGSHTLVASGVDSSGNVRYVNLPVTVSSSGTATVTGKATLAYTGVDVALPLIVGLVAVSLGGGLIFVRRRASRSAA